MQQFQGTQAWHVLDEAKGKYFLVNIVGQSKQTGMTTVEVTNQRFQVPNHQLLQYDPEKPEDIYQLRFINSPEIMDWLDHYGGSQGWVKLNSRVCLDFDSYSEAKRLQHIGYILGRSLVTLRKKQYICVANDVIDRSKNHTVHEAIIKAIRNRTNLWPYAIPLDKLSKIYRSFFSNCAIKFKIYIKETNIIKLAIVPYLLSSKDLFATMSSDHRRLLDLNAQIFSILDGSPGEMKRYFKIPQGSKHSKSQLTVSNLVDCLMSLGLKVGQVNRLISLFAVMMNLNQAEMVRYKRQGKESFRVKQNSIVRQNLQSLLGKRLLEDLYRDLNRFTKDSDRTIENIHIKQEILMRMIWREAILSVAETINEKMINLSADFTSDIRKIVFIEFPAVGQQFQQTVDNYFLSKINTFIKEVAFRIPTTTAPRDIDFSKSQKIYQKIKNNHTYDINKQILSDLEKEMTFQTQLASGDFYKEFRREKLKTETKGSQSRKEEIFHFLDQINQLQQDSPSYHANFIVRSEMGANKRPSAAILGGIRQSIEEKHKREKNAMDKNLQNQFIDYENDEPSKNQILDSSEEEMIEIKMAVFEERYMYCQLIKKAHKSKQATFDWLDNYFDGVQAKGKVMRNNHDEVVCIPESLFKRLEDQRKGHVQNINKIKAQVKRWRYRLKTLDGLHNFSVRIKFYMWLCSRTYPLMKAATKTLRKRMAASRLEDMLYKNCLMKQKYCWRQLKKKQALQKLAVLSEQLKPRSHKQLKRQFIKEANQIRRNQRKYKALENLDQFIERKTLSYEYFFMRKLELNKQKQLKQVALSKLVNTFSKIRQSNLIASLNKIKKCSSIQSHTSSPSKKQPSNINSPSRSPEAERSQPSIHINQPLANSQLNTQDVSPNNTLNIKNNQPNQYLNHSQHQSRSNAPSSIVGIEKSESVYPITKDQLYSLRDCPKFSFQSWYNEAIGFQKRKPVETQKKPGVPKLFKKSHQERPANKEPQQQLNVDILIKEKVVVNPFFPYLLEHVQAQNQKELQKLMSHQSSTLKQPILKKYPTKTYPRVYQQIFNNILKIGKDKNTTKSKQQLINSIVKPLKDSYFQEKKNVANVFEGQPAMIIDYTWEHNILKDEVFLQFIKQIMMNEQEQSLRQLFSALDVITRYYYPSPQFLYAFLHYLKSLQSRNIVKLSSCFSNTLLFAQAYERYKGNNVTVMEQEVIPRQKESYHRLESRVTEITAKQLGSYLTISMRLFNEEVFEYRVRNEDISHFRRKVLKEINFLQYQDYFGTYYCRNKQSGMVMFDESMKAADFLNQYPQSQEEHFCYVRLKYYFPFNLKEINKTRIMYLNSIIEERNLPWKKQDYENIVALSMMFEEFEEFRISNYLKITNQVNEKNLDLTSIQNKYKQMMSVKGQKIGELEYFKVLKQCDFIAAKSYRIKQALSPKSIPSYIIVKPLELCLYEGSQMRSSINLKRVKSHYMQKGQIYLQIDFKGFEAGGMRSITLQGVEKVNQLYQDIIAYIGYLSSI